MKPVHVELLVKVALEVGPPPLKVYVKFDLPHRSENLSECILRKKSFLIRMQQSMGEDLFLVMFVHELAHAYSWDNTADKKDDHDATWGIAYARIYCAVMGVH